MTVKEIREEYDIARKNTLKTYRELIMNNLKEHNLNGMVKRKSDGKIGELHFIDDMYEDLPLNIGFYPYKEVEE